jgi:hypothetical protein
MSPSYVPLDHPEILSYLGIPASDPRVLSAAKALRHIQQIRADRVDLEERALAVLSPIVAARLAGVPGDVLETRSASDAFSVLIQGIVSEREALALLLSLGADPEKLADL